MDYIFFEHVSRFISHGDDAIKLSSRQVTLIKVKSVSYIPIQIIIQQFIVTSGPLDLKVID